MIDIIKKPNTDNEIFTALNPITCKWFKGKFGGFSDSQKYAILNIKKKKNILVSSPTGSGKTLCAFTSILDYLINLTKKNELEDRVYAVYISPLKALSRDVEVNLKTPLKEMEEISGGKFGIRVAVRTGDTKPSERQKMLKKPPHILITTPESLCLMLSSPKFKELLTGVQWGIVDEIHALADNKRGVHLSLSLERLSYVSKDMTRIGLSATIEPVEEIAKFLVGDRECKIANVEFLKKSNLKVVSPVPDLINVTEEKLHNSLYGMLDGLIQQHKTTLIFTNTRAGTERVVHHLKTKFPKKYVENIGAHHGSLSKKHRLKIEERLKKGELKCVVCSTSLELGIDIGYIDLVVCIGSPKGVARFLQRVGRSGHQMHETIKGRVVVLDRDDLVECGVLLKNAIEKKIDKIHIPKNCLDVLAQQIHGMAVTYRWNKKEMFDLIKRSYCYSTLKKDDFEEVLNYLSGEFASLEDRYIYAKIWYDKESGEIGRKGRMSRVIHMTNVGTIPDTTGIRVKIKEQTIGTIDEGFLERLKRGDIFVLGGDVYQFLFSRGMVAQVKSVSGKKPTVPSWYSEVLPLSFDLACDIGKFRRYMLDLFVNNKDKEEIIKFVNKYLYVDGNAANAIYDYFREQFLYVEVPHEKKLLVEFYNSGYANEKKYVVFHSLFGRRVNDVLSRAIGYAIFKIHKRDVEVGINDNGFYLAVPQNRNMQVMRAFDLLKPENLKEVMKIAIDKGEVLKRRFRHCASRALMILRTYKGKKKNVGRQQVSSMILMNAVKRINKDFCILKEARREVLEDLMDVDNAVKILKKIKDEKIEIKQINTSVPSPFAFNLVTQGYTDILRMEDKIEFIKRMHSQVLAKIGKKHKI